MTPPLGPTPQETVSQFDKTVIPGEPNNCERDPWFGRLTTLREVEGESRKVTEHQIVLDLPPTSAGDDKFYTSSKREGLRG